jgi:hypothetical protein
LESPFVSCNCATQHQSLIEDYKLKEGKQENVLSAAEDNIALEAQAVPRSVSRK